jgi:hypothetical protein
MTDSEHPWFIEGNVRMRFPTYQFRAVTPADLPPAPGILAAACAWTRVHWR